MKKTKKIALFSILSIVLFSLFLGCGSHPGEKEYNKAIALWEKGDLVRAQAQLEKAIRQFSVNEKKSVANNQLGIILWNLNKPTQSIDAFRESCRLCDEITQANINLAQVLYYTHDYDGAKFEVTKILNEDPNNPTANIFLGLTYIQKHNWKKAVQFLSKGLQSQPNNSALQTTLALAELHQNPNSTQTINRLQSVLKADPNYTPAIYNLAAIYDKWIHNKKLATEWYKKYLNLADSNDKHYTQARRAVAQLNHSKYTPPQSISATQYITKGTQLHATKNYSKAIEQYQKALRINPKSRTAYYNMGLSYYALKNYSVATKAYINALKINPNDANSRYMLTLCYYQQKQWNTAIHEAKNLQKVDPKRGAELLKSISNARKK